MKYNDFRDKQIELQINWRKKQEISKEYGSQNGKKRAWIVPKTEWENTIWLEIRESLLKYLLNEDVQHHMGVHNLLSSWVLCSNLYFGTYINDNFRELFRMFLEEKLGINIDKIENIYLEFAMDGDLSPANLLGEPEGKRGSGQTSPDVAVSFTSGKENQPVLHPLKMNGKKYLTQNQNLLYGNIKTGLNMLEKIKKNSLKKIG